MANEDEIVVKADGIKEPHLASFNYSDITEADVGKVVSITGEMTVSKTANGSKFDGTLESVEGTVCLVRLDGVFNCSYSGTAPSFGQDTLVADADGKVKKDASGKSYLVLSVDTTNKIVKFLKG
ncbi:MULTISPECIES: hypothetical protein [Leptospira]|uniref:hypothetical protein n=1 Tax=Leptospira TaxID=171 RepID=UPI0007739BEE|nr:MULTISPECIES: hypothetical protein [Leptospira]MBE8363450.1 hypothetical protein [Leptospira borgpetersenii serovar Balcanica]MBE8367108.1 hypothetical protein [Leptospira borgpetersenii serovar Balcanica]MBE8422519.1 hypothetical protein [Leptospira borgpetersenii serovar Balcanica]MBF3349628.1 hypothetical protein [Leptospira borgpetersenii serovar Balcanica]